jgi:hypothetical protein
MALYIFENTSATRFHSIAVYLASYFSPIRKTSCSGSVMLIIRLKCSKANMGYKEHDPRYPTVCLDEKPVVLHADVQPPVPVAPGQPERVDFEYERRGTRNLFVIVEPLAGWRHVEVTEQRTMQDYARVVRWLVDEVYPQAEHIRLMQDNLNTHTPAAFYETFPPAEARRILQRLEFHFTPSTAVG